MSRLVKIKKLSELAKTPTRGSEYAAGYDLYAATSEVTDIAPHSTVKIPTDIAMEIPKRTFGAVFARSGLASKKGLRPANCVGVVDADYRGNIIVALHNDSDLVRTVNNGDRIAQIILQKRYDMDFEEVEELDETERGDGGFGSTGKR